MKKNIFDTYISIIATYAVRDMYITEISFHDIHNSFRDITNTIRDIWNCIRDIMKSISDMYTSRIRILDM